MTEEVREYAEKRILESGIRMVPGHHPDFESKTHVDAWASTLKLREELFEYYFQEYEPVGILDMTAVDFDEYKSLLESLKRNKENVPLELLKTKYQKAYDQLKEKIKVMTEAMIVDIVTYDLLIERDRLEEMLVKIEATISESGMLQQISHAAFRHQDADQVLEYAEQLRKIVHAVAES